MGHINKETAILIAGSQLGKIFHEKLNIDTWDHEMGIEYQVYEDPHSRHTAVVCSMAVMGHKETVTVPYQADSSIVVTGLEFYDEDGNSLKSDSELPILVDE